MRVLTGGYLPLNEPQKLANLIRLATFLNHDNSRNILLKVNYVKPTVFVNFAGECNQEHVV
jgi:hypothetical protein